MILKERMMQELKIVRMVKEVCMPRLRIEFYEEVSCLAVSKVLLYAREFM
jgi:hypothetical protein